MANPRLDPSLRRLLSLPEACGVLGISYRAGLRRVRDGTLPAIRLGGQYRISGKYVAELLLAAGENQPLRVAIVEPAAWPDEDEEIAA